jgi:membrane protein required for colicin V production
MTRVAALAIHHVLSGHPERTQPKSQNPSKVSPEDPAMYLDIFLIVVMFVSGLLAMVRGLIREVLSIAGWGAAAGAALFAYAKVLPSAKSYFNTLNDYVVAGGTVATFFIGTLIIVSIITVKISDKSLDSRIGALDRTLGFLFGLARGLLIVVVMFAFYDWFQPKSQPGWIANAKSLFVLKSLRDDIISVSPDIEAWYSRYKKQKEGAGPPA